MKKRLYAILSSLGLTERFERRELTEEEFQNVMQEYREKYGSELEADMDSNAQEVLNRVYDAVAAVAQTTGTGDEAPARQEDASLDGVVAAINNLGSRIEQLAAQPQPDQVTVEVATTQPLAINGPGNTPDYFLGIENEMFSMQRRYNQIAANPRAARAMADADDSEVSQFYRDLHAYSRSLQKRFAYLQQNAMLNPTLLAQGEFATDYNGVAAAGVGNQYVVLRQDALIARVLKKRALTDFFPVRYGVQDRDLLFNAFFGELSQAYQQGEIYKGGVKVENEMGYVDDAMIKIQFGPMKELERMYIAYLNRDGSDPIKWTMIEFCLLNQLEQAQVEQNKRRVRGIYVKPESGVAGSYLNAGTGLVYTLLRYIHDYSIMPHDSADYRSYTSADMLDAVQEFIEDVTTSLSEDADLSQHVLYLNERHKPWWIKNIRAKYHLDTDFQGTGSLVNRVPETDIQVRWLPYLGSLPLMLLDIPGNLQFIEYLPGEMLAVKMEEQMEMVRAWSTWKEGCGAAFTGRKFSNRSDMEANAFEYQQIFCNWPAAPITDAVDATKGFLHTTTADTTATSITDIAGAKEGVAYSIEIGDASKRPTIAKSGKFSAITAAWTPAQLGDYIMVILGSDGKFRELERRVGGVRTINAAVQPNVPGGR